MTRRLVTRVRTQAAKASDRRMAEVRKQAAEKAEEKKKLKRRPKKESRRLIALRALGFRNYEEYLKSPGWIEKRDAAVARAHNKCQLCNDFRWTLNVHHNTYENLGSEWNSDLVVLCGPCHIVYHSPAFKKMVVKAKRQLMQRKPRRKRQIQIPKSAGELRDEVNEQAPAPERR